MANSVCGKNAAQERHLMLATCGTEAGFSVLIVHFWLHAFSMWSGTFPHGACMHGTWLGMGTSCRGALSAATLIVVCAWLMYWFVVGTVQHVVDISSALTGVSDMEVVGYHWAVCP
jgi:hypothetical protein